MYFYNQRDYAGLNYKSSKHPNATISSSGCGVCATAMIVNNLAGKELYTVKAMRDLSVSSGARVAGGTDVSTLLNAVRKAHREFSFTTTNDEAKLVAHLKAGGMAIANQGDAYNVFSTAGHFVVAESMVGKNINILDPYMYTGKYDTSPRTSRIIKKTNYGCVVSPTQIGKATADRSPSYYLVTYTKPVTQTKTSIKPTATTSVKYVKTNGGYLNVRKGAGLKYSVIENLKNGTKVTVYKTSGTWSKISKTEEKWVSSSYLTSTAPVSTNSQPKKKETPKYKTTIGKRYRLNKNTLLYSKGNLTGTKYDYLAKTEIEVIGHYSEKVDRVRVVKTGRVAYCEVSAFV